MAHIRLRNTLFARARVNHMPIIITGSRKTEKSHCTHTHNAKAFNIQTEASAPCMTNSGHEFFSGTRRLCSITKTHPPTPHHCLIIDSKRRLRKHRGLLSLVSLVRLLGPHMQRARVFAHVLYNFFLLLACAALTRLPVGILYITVDTQPTLGQSVSQSHTLV